MHASCFIYSPPPGAQAPCCSHDVLSQRLNTDAGASVTQGIRALTTVLSGNFWAIYLSFNISNAFIHSIRGC